MPSRNIPRETQPLIERDPETGEKFEKEETVEFEIAPGGHENGLMEVEGTEGEAQSMQEAVAVAIEESKKVLKADEQPTGGKPGGDATKGSGASQAMIAAVVVVAFIAADAGKIIMEAFALKPGLNSAAYLIVVAIMNTILSLVMSLALLGLQDGSNALFNKNIVKYFSPALFFAASQLFNVLQGDLVGGGLRKVFQQLRLPITAFMSKFIMGHGYTSLQWYLITVVTLCIPAFYSVGSADGKLFSDSKVITGLVFALISNICACMGSLLAEKKLKDMKNVPFYVQKFQIELWTLVCGFFNFLLLNPLAAILADAIQGNTGGDKAMPSFRKALVLNYKNAINNYTPAHADLAWDDASNVTGLKFANKLDTRKWEKMQIENHKFSKDLRGDDITELEKIVKTYEDLLVDRNTAKFHDADKTDYKKARIELPSFQQWSGKKDAAMLKAVQKQHKFFTAHPFSYAVQTWSASKLKRAFSFTFGRDLLNDTLKGNDKPTFFSELMYDRPSPRFVRSIALKQTADRWDNSDFTEEEMKNFFDGEATHFASKKEDVFTAKSEVNDEVLKTYPEMVGQTLPKKAKQALEVKRQAFFVPTSDAVTKFEERAKGKVVLSMHFNRKLDFKDAAKNMECNAGFVRNFVLDCSAAAHPTMDDNSAHNGNPTVLAKTKSMNFEDADELYAKQFKDCVLKQEEDMFKDAKCSEKAKKAEAKKTEKVKKAYEAELAAFPDSFVKNKAAKVATGSDEKNLKALQAFFKTELDGYNVKAFEVAAKNTKRFEQHATNSNSPDALKGILYNVHTYPGENAAGVLNGDGAFCDTAVCALTDAEWKENFAMHTNDVKNNPEASKAHATLPFSQAELFGFTRNPIPYATWSFALLLAIIANGAQSWLSGLLSKTLSTLWKNLCQCVALALVIFVEKAFVYPAWDGRVTMTPLLTGGPKWIEVILASALILMAIWAFGQAPKAPKTEKKH